MSAQIQIHYAQRVVYEEVKQRDPAQSTTEWRRLEKIGDKDASIPDTMPTVLVVQDAGGQIVDCSKGNARTRCLVRAQKRGQVKIEWKKTSVCS